MRPATSTPTSGTQSNGESAAVEDSGCMIPRPTTSEFRRLVAGPLENIIHAMGITPTAFDTFKKVLRDRALILLDCERFLYEQNPDAWAAYLDWAREELAPMVSKYVDAWPIELYIEYYLSKRTYHKRHTFRKRSQYAAKSVRIKSPPPERNPNLSAPTGLPPPYEEHEFDYPDVITRFLQSINPDLGHLVLAFGELGINNEADLVVVRSWPPAVRKDFFERELVGKMSALQVQALNVRLGEM